MKKSLIIILLIFVCSGIYSQTEYQKAKEMSDSLIISLVGKDYFFRNIKFRFDKSKYSTIVPAKKTRNPWDFELEKEKQYSLSKNLKKNARRFILYYEYRIELLDTVMPIVIMIRDNEIADFSGTIKCEANNNCLLSIDKDSATVIVNKELKNNEKIIFVNFIWVRKYHPYIAVDKDGNVKQWGPNMNNPNIDKIIKKMHEEKYGNYVWHFCISDGTKNNLMFQSVCNRQIMIDAISGNIINE